MFYCDRCETIKEIKNTQKLFINLLDTINEFKNIH